MFFFESFPDSKTVLVSFSNFRTFKTQTFNSNFGFPNPFSIFRTLIDSYLCIFLKTAVNWYAIFITWKNHTTGYKSSLKLVNTNLYKNVKIQVKEGSNIDHHWLLYHVHKEQLQLLIPDVAGIFLVDECHLS